MRFAGGGRNSRPRAHFPFAFQIQIQIKTLIFLPRRLKKKNEKRLTNDARRVSPFSGEKEAVRLEAPNELVHVLTNGHA